MSNRNASRLEAGLIARKGEAAPAQSRPQLPPSHSEEEIGQSVAGDILDKVTASRMPRRLQGTIAVTVRLDPGRYERMKVYGARRRLTNQDILVEALDRYFALLPE